MAHTFGEAPNGGIQPTTPVRPAAMAERLPHAATPLFFLKFHPLRWQLIGDELLPLLGTFRVDLGVGGVDKTGNTDEADLMDAKTGWTRIPWEVIPDSYIRSWPAQGGMYNCTKWEQPQHVGGRVLASKVDSEGYNDFLRMLVREGWVPKPDPAVIDQTLVETQRKRIQNLVGESHKPGVQPILEREEKRLAAMERANAGAAV
jgi:hypothetical protein